METKKVLMMFAATMGLATAASFAQDGANIQVTQPVATTPPVVPVTTGTVVVPAQTVPVQQPVAVPAQPVAVPAQPAVVAPTAVNVNVDNDRHDDDHHDLDGEFSIQPGVALFQGSSKDYLDDSFSIDVGLYDQWNDISGMGWELGYITDADVKGVPPARLDIDLNNDGIPDTSSFAGRSSARILHLTPLLRLGPVFKNGKTRVNPYVSGGGGFYWTNFDGDVGNDDNYNGGWNAGGGLLVGLTDDFGIGFDVRYHRIIYSSGPDTTWITPSAKISLLFD
jgi:hypothetical protein